MAEFLAAAGIDTPGMLPPVFGNTSRMDRVAVETVDRFTTAAAEREIPARRITVTINVTIAIVAETCISHLIPPT